MNGEKQRTFQSLLRSEDEFYGTILGNITDMLKCLRVKKSTEVLNMANQWNLKWEKERVITMAGALYLGVFLGNGYTKNGQKMKQNRQNRARKWEEYGKLKPKANTSLMGRDGLKAVMIKGSRLKNGTLLLGLEGSLTLYK
ncbi:hypothetical protein Tco_0855938 [Tanacetum coccineum]